MNNIHNFANRQLCEYQSIFPNVVALLDHLLFTIGNGNEFDEETGMIFTHTDKNKWVAINEYPRMTDARWKKLIMDCHAKERKFAQQFANSVAINEDTVAAACAKYKIVAVNDSMFSADELYQQLREWSNERRTETIMNFSPDTFVRPYPLSQDYSDIFKLNERTPAWFLQIAFNLCQAWVKFLDDEIEYKNVWIKPSLRIKRPGWEQRAESMKALFDMLRAGDSYDGWLDKPEPETDYADLDWTTRHRNMLSHEVVRIGELLIKKSGFAIGDQIVMETRNPYYTHQGCAEPMPGMQAKVEQLGSDDPRLFGKIMVEFDPRVLGYEDDDENEPLFLYVSPWLFRKL